MNQSSQAIFVNFENSFLSQSSLTSCHGPGSGSHVIYPEQFQIASEIVIEK